MINPEKFDFKKLVFLLFVGAACSLIAYLVDKSVLYYSLTIVNPTAVLVSTLITMLGEVQYAFLIIAIYTIVCIVYKKPFIASWLAVLISSIMTFALKYIIARPRPFIFLGIQSLIQETSYSFPSGHATIVFTILPFLTKNYPRQKLIFWVLACLVALSRVYLEVHYLSDVVAGAFMGYIVGWLFIWIGERYAWY